MGSREGNMRRKKLPELQQDARLFAGVCYHEADRKRYREFHGIPEKVYPQNIAEAEAMAQEGSTCNGHTD